MQGLCDFEILRPPDLVILIFQCHQMFLYQDMNPFSHLLGLIPSLLSSSCPIGLEFAKPQPRREEEGVGLKTENSGGGREAHGVGRNQALSQP